MAFVILASVLIALRAGGEAVGWAFQFQQPWFLAFIVYLFFLMGLSLSGVFEIGTSLMGAGSSLTARGGYQGSFFTVCWHYRRNAVHGTFYGAGDRFALAQSGWWPWLYCLAGSGYGFSDFVAELLTALFRFLPKPGPWMETFKQFMAFPLYASALFFSGCSVIRWE